MTKNRKIGIFKYPNMVIIVDGGIRRIVSDVTIINMPQDKIREWYLKGGETDDKQ